MRNWRIEYGNPREGSWLLDGSRSRLVSRFLGVGESPSLAFGAPAAYEEGYRSGDWIGSVEAGGACNCFVLTLNPHCHTTHTESVGHLTRQRESVFATGIGREPFLAQLVTVQAVAASSTTATYTPALLATDQIVPAHAFETIERHPAAQGLILRVLSGPASEPPFFSHEAMRWIVEQGIEHLLVELPSVDRTDDEGLLSNHRIFWNLPPQADEITPETRRHCTITELLDLPADLPDGLYGVLIHLPPISGDALPSSVYLMPAQAALANDSF